MICVMCKGRVSRKTVQEDIPVGNDHFLVKLEAEVCENCDERYYDDETVGYLEKLRQDLKTRKEHLKPIGQVYDVA